MSTSLFFLLLTEFNIAPTVKALLSIERYLETNKFKHVYEPLKEKV